MSGLLGTLNIGKSGMFVSQKSIDVTSHNIANVNTEGYSRQRAELQTRRPFCTPSMNNAAEPGQLGTGVDVTQIARIRDSFLDYQVRVELGVQGHCIGREKFLSEIENIFAEPSDTGLSTLMGKFFYSWQEFSKHPEVSNSRTVVAEQTKALASELNHTQTQLEKLKANAQDMTKQTIIEANSMIKQIGQLNKEILQISAAHNNPNDLMDRRDLLLDKLSSKFGIQIRKRALNGIDVCAKNIDKKGENSNDYPGANAPAGLNLVQTVEPEHTATLSYINTIEPQDDIKPGEAGKYKITYYKYGDTTTERNKKEFIVEIQDDADLTKPGAMSAKEKFKMLDETRTLWANKDGVALQRTSAPTDKEIEIKDNDTINFDKVALFTPNSGELRGYISVQEDVDTYEERLNKMVKSLVYSVNTIHSQSDDPSGDDLPFFVNSDVAKYDPVTYELLNLKEVQEAEKDINPSNISINKTILQNVMLIKAGRTKDSGEGDGKRALAVANIMDKLMKIQDVNIDEGSKTTRSEFIKKFCGGLVDSELGVKVMKGDVDGMKVDNYFKDMVDTLGVQAQEAKRGVENQLKVLTSFKQSRSSVSGVSMNEEMTNLIQFQHAFQANAKIISTVDQLLDVVVNGLKR